MIAYQRLVKNTYIFFLLIGTIKCIFVTSTDMIYHTFSCLEDNGGGGECEIVDATNLLRVSMHYYFEYKHSSGGFLFNFLMSQVDY